MKKILFVLLFSIMLTGCASDDSGNGKGKTDVNLNEGIDQGEVIEEKPGEEENEVPIKPDEVEPEITLLEPDSIGNVYMKATYTNNTKYPITGYNLTILKKDTNEKTYLGTYDTVMPGETSPTFESSGPNTRKEEDYEILKLEVTAKTEEGTELHLDYDFKLGEVEWNEYD